MWNPSFGLGDPRAIRVWMDGNTEILIIPVIAGESKKQFIASIASLVLGTYTTHMLISMCVCHPHVHG